MSYEVKLGGNKKVSITIDGITVETDQPKERGGDSSAPAPFDLFLASVGTCAGFYVQSFCEARKLPTAGIKITQDVQWNEDETLVKKIVIDIQLPGGFPEKYKPALLAAVDHCTVKRHLKNPPEIIVEA